MKQILFALAFLSSSLTARAAEPIYAKGGLAIGGYDPVAYFTDGKPVKGKAEFETDWSGARWRFASAEHRDAFKAEAARYAPQFGGYCAYGVSKGHKAPTEADAWSVVDGKLYLNYNKDVQRLWEKERPAVIGEAERQWPGVLAK